MRAYNAAGTIRGAEHLTGVSAKEIQRMFTLEGIVAAYDLPRSYAEEELRAAKDALTTDPGTAALEAGISNGMLDARLKKMIEKGDEEALQVKEYRDWRSKKIRSRGVSVGAIMDTIRLTDVLDDRSTEPDPS